MIVTSPQGLFKPQTIDVYPCLDAPERSNALLVLRRDEAEFLDAVYLRLVGLPTPGGAACVLDHRHWEAQLVGGPDAAAASRALQAAISTMQASCIARHGRRFQHLDARVQSRVLETIEAKGSLVERVQLRVIAAELAFI
jgi:hypothetical protein